MYCICAHEGLWRDTKKYHFSHFSQSVRAYFAFLYILTLATSQIEQHLQTLQTGGLYCLQLRGKFLISKSIKFVGDELLEVLFAFSVLYFQYVYLPLVNCLGPFEKHSSEEVYFGLMDHKWTAGIFLRLLPMTMKKTAFEIFIASLGASVCEMNQCSGDIGKRLHDEWRETGAFRTMLSPQI